MLHEVEWAEDGTYRYGDYYSPEKFFNDCLKNSTEFDLQLGYFSSATISVLADGFATFISNGGRMRLIINHIVSQKDKYAISKGMNDNAIDCFDLSNFEVLRRTFDEYQQQFFECLAYLIRNNRIDIRIIRPRNRMGIAHTKSGQFRDSHSTTSFTGSANFTISGLFNNIEEIKIDRSDSTDKMVQKRIATQYQEFDAIMLHRKNDIEYLSPDKLICAIESNYGDKDIDELLNVEEQLRKIKKQRERWELKEDTDMACEDSFDIKPHFPYNTGPRDYQIEAFECWKKNKQKGLFAMATGTGKTLTALNCLLEIYKRKEYYKAIILVPTIVLVDQWERDCQKCGMMRIVRVCSNNPQWKSDIAVLQNIERYVNPQISYIIIATYASYSRAAIFSELNAFDASKVLFIADEAHNMGSGRIANIMEGIHYARRIGLSATPYRQYDNSINQKLFDFFGATNGFTFNFPMEKAIEEGFLCRYKYYPHIVRLTEDEMNEYAKISLQLVKMFNFESNSFNNMSEPLKLLLLKRKRIIHKAKMKEDQLRSIVHKCFRDRGNLKYTLIYVPEGEYGDDYFVNNESLPEEVETNRLIDRYTSIVREVSSTTTVRKFVSETVERDVMLKDFAEGRLDVLTSMKCLDEGVDVPRSELAIFCASTGNPRQFIQRRGRILRTHPEKRIAEIHDLVVVPQIDTSETNYTMERSLIRGEMVRVRDFASLSENADSTIRELAEILDYYNIELPIN